MMYYKKQAAVKKAKINDAPPKKAKINDAPPKLCSSKEG